jgi:hypothetical protein
MWPTLIPLLGNLMDKLFPDPGVAANAKLELMKLAQTGELEQLHADLQMATGQMDINKVEAANPTLFISGWRPFIGWVCGLGCAWNWIGLPVGIFVAGLLGQHLDLKQADLSEMMPLLMGMLGMGAMRSYEKVKGVAAK